MSNPRMGHFPGALGSWGKTGSSRGKAPVSGPPLLTGQAGESLQLDERSMASVQRKASDQASSSTGSDGVKVSNFANLAAGQHSDACPHPRSVTDGTPDARIIVA